MFGAAPVDEGNLVGEHRGWLSATTAQWIEHVVTRFGAPTTPIVVRKSEEAPPAENSR